MSVVMCKDEVWEVLNKFFDKVQARQIKGDPGTRKKSSKVYSLADDMKCFEIALFLDNCNFEIVFILRLYSSWTTATLRLRLSRKNAISNYEIVFECYSFNVYWEFT